MENYDSPRPQGMSPLAIAAAVCGAVSFLGSWSGFCCGCIPCATGILGLAAIALGLVANSKVGKGEASESSKLPALVGAGLGAGGTLISGGLFVFAVVAGGLSTYLDQMQNF